MSYDVRSNERHVDLKTADDHDWFIDGEREGYKLPPPASWPWRLWGVRHVRHVWHLIGAEQQAMRYARAGIGLGHVNQYDRWVLHAIRRGWI